MSPPSSSSEVESDPIHELNDQGFLAITTSEQAAEYLTFFCTHILGDEGAFMRAFMIIPGSVDVRPREDGPGWHATAQVSYGADLFKAGFRIDPSGEVEMVSDKPIGRAPASPRPLYAPPISWLEGDGSDWQDRPDKPNPDWPVSSPLGPSSAWFEPETEGEDGEIWNALRKKQETLGPSIVLPWPGRPRPRIDLKGLRVSGLDDDDGRAWFAGRNFDLDKAVTGEVGIRPTLQLMLSGFEYDRISDRPDPTPWTDVLGQELSDSDSPAPEEAAKEPAKERSLFQRLRSFLHSDPAERLKARRYWLKAQYMKRYRPTEDEYRPQPYEQLARVWRAAGHLKNADDITIDKLASGEGKAQALKARLCRRGRMFWHRVAQTRGTAWFRFSSDSG